MGKVEDRRAAIIETLVDHVLANGLAATSLRPLAKAAGTSDRMLLYYFKDKDEIVRAILEQGALRLTHLLEKRKTPEPLPRQQLLVALVDILFADDLMPYMRLALEIASLAARGDPLYRLVGEQIERGFLAWAGAQLDCADDAERAVEAAQLLITLEGILFLKSVGLDDVCKLIL